MANYNPYAPYILGQEWVPIRNNSYSYSQDANSFELGTRLTTTQGYTLSEGRFYVDQMPPQFYRDQIMNISIYPRGKEVETGPIRRVVIPCNNGNVSGGVTFIPNIAANTSVARNLFDPGGDYALTLNYGILVSEGVAMTRNVAMWFATNQYAIPLQGKRILGVNFLWNMTMANIEQLPSAAGNFLQLSVRDDNNPNLAPLIYYPDLFLASQFVGDAGISRMRLGDTAQFFNNTIYSTDIAPWRYQDLQRFEQSATNPLHMRLQLTSQSGTFTAAFLSYAALEVFFCEETRIATGSHVYNNGAFSNTGSPTGGFEISYTQGANPIVMRDPITGVASPFLPAGDYTVTLSQGNWGDVASTSLTTHPEPTVNAAYQLYELPTIPATKISIPVPTAPAIDGKVLTKASSQILPQISLHSSGGTVIPDVHVYGKQSRGQVWGTNTVTQVIQDNTGTARSYPNVRFWARRFGDTSVSLTVASGASTTSITPVSFDLLDEIVDGWKQIDLRFGTSLTLGAGTNPTLTWSATGETAGNRWEVLGAQAPAMSGIVGNNQNQATVQLGSATYGEPLSGSQVREAWMPQFAPQVSSTTADPTADVSVLLSVDPFAVSGFGVLPQAQALTGINTYCNNAQFFVPTALAYNRITWSTSPTASLPISGFGYYELQRLDTLTDWQTIMHATSPTVSGFNDFEARVGVLTSYRIRAVNNYLFAGPWSSTITSTLTSPGLTGSGMTTNNFAMLFTSNQAQNGARNLAYAMAWEGGNTTENFAFPEAGWNKLQPMFGRDFFTAFHPTERGGVQFSRTVLVNACAIATPPTLPNFVSLRDLAWDSLPYVCLRDEDGNRWFTNITVPTGRVENRRNLYLADFQMTEVTATAAVITVAS